MRIVSEEKIGKNDAGLKIQVKRKIQRKLSGTVIHTYCNCKVEKDCRVCPNRHLFVFVGLMIFRCLQLVCIVHHNKFVQYYFAMKSNLYPAL
ncbi:MAG: hypothetical protein D4R64_15935 [Porphyromonadaceae bacterium]|nr:MAG: hypothetical protein D4R64_15935 [Porphyromonadaceae bacterium]